MGWIAAYRLRIRRKRLLYRAYRARRDLISAQDRTSSIRRHDVLLCACIRNEMVRLPYFIDYYRQLGISHFLIIDNGSEDGSAEWLARQPDVSLWSTKASYKAARYGLDWQNWLLRKYGHGHWCLTVDADEFLVYPFSDTRPLRALTDWLDASGVRSLSAMLIDTYPRGKISDHPYRQGENPFEIARWFDAGNYTVKKNPDLDNLWIQGGPRARVFFADDPASAPALNKVPLVKWRRSYAYVSSTHMMLPRGMNRSYDEFGGEKISGCLMHSKFIDTLGAKVEEELQRRQHFAQSAEYAAYKQGLTETPELWCQWSEEYINWRQLEILGLLSKGNWA